jgi:uncharacterized cupredoxin-like copper-binding protein
MPQTAALTPIAIALLLVGCSSGPDDGGASSGDGPLAMTAGDLYFAADGERSDEDELTFRATPGPVEVQLDNQGATAHNVTVDADGGTTVVGAGPGEQASGTIDLPTGTYTLYCSIPGHRDAGMEAQLEVA